MSLSDCVKCWNTPCMCGYDYRKWTRNQRIEQAAAVLGIESSVLKKEIKDITPKKHPMFDEK